MSPFMVPPPLFLPPSRSFSRQPLSPSVVPPSLSREESMKETAGFEDAGALQSARRTESEVPPPPRSAPAAAAARQDPLSPRSMMLERAEAMAREQPMRRSLTGEDVLLLSL